MNHHAPGQRRHENDGWPGQGRHQVPCRRRLPSEEVIAWVRQTSHSEKSAIQSLLPQGKRFGSKVFLCLFSQPFTKYSSVGNSWMGIHNYRARGIVWSWLWAELCPLQNPYVEVPSTSEYDCFGGTAFKEVLKVK